MKMKMAVAVLTLLSFADVEATAGPLPTSVVPNGLGVNVAYNTLTSQDLNMIQAAGFKYVRMDIQWTAIEKTKGVYDFALYDQLYNECAARGIGVLGILDYGNSLYGTNLSTDTFRNGFTQFAAAAAQHFQNDGILWELWNEPNLDHFWPPAADANQYMALANQAIPAIRMADPSATVIGPAVSKFGISFLTTCFDYGNANPGQKGLLDLVDAVSVHPYLKGPPEDLTTTSRYPDLVNLMQQYDPSGAIPIVSSEWGYNTAGGGISEQTQGDYLARMFLVNLSQGIPLSIWFDWKDNGTSSDHFGVVDANEGIKPAYTEMQLLSTSLAGESFFTKLASASEDWLLVFKSPGGYETLAAWTTGSAHYTNDPTWGTLYLTPTPMYNTIAPPSPRISAALSAGNSSLVLAWPTNQGGFILQSTADFTQPGTWSNVTTAPVIITGHYVVTNPISGSQQFFRLKE